MLNKFLMWFCDAMSWLQGYINASPWAITFIYIILGATILATTKLIGLLALLGIIAIRIIDQIDWWKHYRDIQNKGKKVDPYDARRTL